MIRSDEGIKLGLFYGEVIGTILEDSDGIVLGIAVGTELGYLDGSFGDSTDDNLEGLLLVGSLVSTDDKVLGFYEVVKLGLFDGEVIGTILGDVGGITLGIDVVIELVSLDGSFGGIISWEFIGIYWL